MKVNATIKQNWKLKKALHRYPVGCT